MELNNEVENAGSSSEGSSSEDECPDEFQDQLRVGANIKLAEKYKLACSLFNAQPTMEPNRGFGFVCDLMDVWRSSHKDKHIQNNFDILNSIISRLRENRNP